MRTYFPFTDYDFWAYISAGFAVLFLTDHIFILHLVIRPAWTVVEIIFAIAGAYSIGHLAAGIASALLERRLVKRLLGTPARNLFIKSQTCKLFRIIYPSYFDQLPSELRRLILRKAKMLGVHNHGESLFLAAHNIAKQNPVAYARMTTFLNQYGFCRNLSFVSLISCVALSASGFLQRQEDFYWAIATFLLFLGLFLRYLKFYRHFALEVFTTFAFHKDI